jgi:hypothetical protein
VIEPWFMGELLMRRMLTLVLGLALGLPFLAGCHLFNNSRSRDNIKIPAHTDQKPTVGSLVNYLNQNARLVQSLQASVDVDAKQGRQLSINLGGALAAQKPRDFRLRAKVVGSPAVDIGSNDDRFWYWISKANPPHYYFCTYKDLSTGKVNVPFPVETDMVLAALNMAEYDPKGKYELKQTKETIELTQDTVSLAGQPVKRVTVFRGTMAKLGEPQVLEHILRDGRGNLICKASVQRVEVDRASKAVIPTRVMIEWPAQQVSMKLMLSDLQVNRIDKESAAAMFQLNAMSGYDFYDLARNAVVKPSSYRRASADRTR